MVKKEMNVPTTFHSNKRLASVVKELGLYNTYIMDDFVLEKDQVYLLCTGNNGEDVFLYFNENSKEAERDAIVSKIIIAGEYRGLRIKMQGLYKLNVDENDMIELKFRESVRTQYK